MSEQTRQLAERIARELFTNEKGKRMRALNLYEGAVARLIDKYLTEAAGASVPQEAIGEDVARALRTYLWLSHGHRSIYGDDGEMQCGECMPWGMYDYKREPLEKVITTAIAALRAVNAKAFGRMTWGQSSTPEQEKLAHEHKNCAGEASSAPQGEHKLRERFEPKA